MPRRDVLDALVQDARFALRAFRKQPGWTAIAVLTLALGIGANTAMFSVLNGMLLHPLPYPGADRIALISIEPRGIAAGAFGLMPESDEILAWSTHAHSLEVLEAYGLKRNQLLPLPDGRVTALHSALITPSFAAFAGQRPILGRGFSPADSAAGAPKVVMLSEHVWRTRFGGSPHVLGTALTLNDTAYVVVGVMPDALRLPLGGTLQTPDLWLPLNIVAAHGGFTITRLRPGVTIAQATRELTLLLSRTRPSFASDTSRFAVALESPRSLVHSRDTLIMLWAAGALVLLIACVNVAHLLLARSATRERELAIRFALGAGRWRLARQLLTESVLLTAAGCAIGAWIGWLGLRELMAMRPAALTGIGVPRLDGTVLAVTVGVSAAAALAFGIVGALRLGRHSTHEALQAGAPSTPGSRGQHRLRSTLVTAEMALSALLLVGAILLVRSVMHLESIDPVFQPHGLYAVNVNLPRTRYATPAARAAFLFELAARARSLPDVRALTMGNGVPPDLLGFARASIQAEGKPPIPISRSYAQANDLSPSYFRVLGLPIVEGSTFTDTSTTSNQIILNQTAARALWPGEHAVGQRVKLGGMIGVGPKWREVVGVVADAPVAGLLRTEKLPALYEPRTGPGIGEIIVRTSGNVDPSARLRALVVSMDKQLPPPTIISVEHDMAETMAPVRFNMALLAAFTMIAVVLAAVGLYGVLAYAVARRTREIGIRIALGATPQNVGRMVVRQGVVLATVGGAIGLVAAFWATRLMANLIYGVPRTDVVSFTIGALALLGAALVACAVPARRATRVDPAVAMRAE